MDAQPELVLLARALNENRLEAILIGNMAAALHGAPVSTIDIDLYFRKTPANMRKLKQVATALDFLRRVWTTSSETIGRRILPE